MITESTEKDTSLGLNFSVSSVVNAFDFWLGLGEG